MNVEHEFIVLESDNRQRTQVYDIAFSTSDFCRNSQNGRQCPNSSRLVLTYTPRARLVEFCSLHDYLAKYASLPMALENACQSVLDDFFHSVEPFYCSVDIYSELSDGMTIHIAAERCWNGTMNAVGSNGSGAPTASGTEL